MKIVKNTAFVLMLLYGAFMIYMRFANPTLTDVQFMLAYWQRYIVFILLLIVAFWKE